MKNKKSSPDEFEDYFRTPGDTGFAPSQRGETRVFSLSKNIWQAIISDPSHRAEVDALVEQRAAERIDQKLSDLKEESKRQGFEQGLNEAKLHVQEKVDRIEKLFSAVCETLLREKGEILCEHERSWGEALEYCLQRFLVPQADQKLFVAKEWLEQSLSGFSENAKVVVFLNPTDFNAGEPQFVNFRGDRWEFRPDSRLKPGEIRAECEGGGVHYDPQEQRERLELILQRVTRGQ